DDLVQHHEVKRAGTEGKIFARREHQAGGGARPLPQPLRVDVDAHDVIAELAELAHVEAEAAADVEDARAFEGEELPDEIKTAVLAGPPNETGIPEGHLGPVGRLDHASHQCPRRSDGSRLGRAALEL